MQAKLLSYDWFREAVGDDLKYYVSNFASSGKTQEALLLWIDRESARLDKAITLTALENTPNRAELTLMVAAQKDVLNRVRKLFDLVEVTGEDNG